MTEIFQHFWNNRKLIWGSKPEKSVEWRCANRSSADFPNKKIVVPLLCMCVFIYVHKILLKNLSAEVVQHQICFHPQHNAFGLPAAMVRWLTVIVSSSCAVINLASFATLRAVLARDCHGNTHMQRRNEKGERRVKEEGREFLILW